MVPPSSGRQFSSPGAQDRLPAMADLYAELPVVRVRDWRGVTPSFLADALADVKRRAARREIDMRRLYLPYWVARFTEHMAAVK